MSEDPAANVTSWYDALSPSYDELYATEQKPKHEKILEHIGRQSIPILLDIGCGTGTFLARAAGLYDYAIGIDPSRGMLRIARTRRSPKQDLIQAASPFLPIKDSSIDCTVSISTSRGDRTLQQYIAEIERVNQNSSTLAITVLEPPERKNLSSHGTLEHLYEISSRERLYILKIKPSDPTRGVGCEALGEFKN